MAPGGLPFRYFGTRHRWSYDQPHRIEGECGYIGYMARPVDRYRMEGSSGPEVVGNIVNRMAWEREVDAGLGNPWWM